SAVSMIVYFFYMVNHMCFCKGIKNIFTVFPNILYLYSLNTHFLFQCLSTQVFLVFLYLSFPLEFNPKLFL
ncbi:hypothetical protein L9F63_019133, partial [Diploptera punctata]